MIIKNNKLSHQIERSSKSNLLEEVSEIQICENSATTPRAKNEKTLTISYPKRIITYAEILEEGKSRNASSSEFKELLFSQERPHKMANSIFVDFTNRLRQIDHGTMLMPNAQAIILDIEHDAILCAIQMILDKQKVSFHTKSQENQSLLDSFDWMNEQIQAAQKGNLNTAEKKYLICKLCKDFEVFLEDLESASLNPEASLAHNELTQEKDSQKNPIKPKQGNCCIIS